MSTRSFAVGLIFLSSATYACASGGGTGDGDGSGAGLARVGGSGTSMRSSTVSGPTGRDVILAAEISERASEATTALDVIRKLRPQMLRNRGVASPSDSTGETARPRVYVDNVLFGDTDRLQSVIASTISEIRFINASDATTRFGTGHTGGVISILTKR